MRVSLATGGNAVMTGYAVIEKGTMVYCTLSGHPSHGAVAELTDIVTRNVAGRLT